MKREDLIPAGMSAGLYHLLQDMHRHWRSWSPALDYPSRSPMLSTGGLVTGCEDFEEAVDNFAVGVLEVAWDALARVEKRAVELAMGWCEPTQAEWCAMHLAGVTTVRNSVANLDALQTAIGRLERACRAQGVL